MIATRHFYGVRAALWAPALLLTFAWQARAVHFTLASAGPPTWTYTLTYDPLDNYNVITSPTTITLSGLTGVTAAGVPTSTDFPPALNASELMWTATVSNGGTTVTWTNTGPGTGNFPTPQHVFGFTVTAPGAPNGTASFVTNGIALNTPPTSRDISGTVAGPSPNTTAGVPVMSPAAFLLTMIGLAGVGAWESRRRWQSWFGRHV